MICLCEWGSVGGVGVWRCGLSDSWSWTVTSNVSLSAANIYFSHHFSSRATRNFSPSSILQMERSKWKHSFPLSGRHEIAVSVRFLGLLSALFYILWNGGLEGNDETRCRWFYAVQLTLEDKIYWEFGIDGKVWGFTKRIWPWEHMLLRIYLCEWRVEGREGRMWFEWRLVGERVRELLR